MALYIVGVASVAKLVGFYAGFYTLFEVLDSVQTSILSIMYKK